MKNLFTALSFLLTVNGFAQAIVADSIAQLNPPLQESSGLTIVKNHLITIGDSGNPPALYQIDTSTGTATRTVYLANATNVDWEALAADSTHIYIGDFGNNLGNRQDLRIYKVSITDYLTTATDTITAQTISFNYTEQTNFTPAPFQTNFDAEALISYRDSLYIFTKQWSKPGTTVYAISKIPGQYTLAKRDTLPATGLVTGGAFNFYFDALTLTTNTPSGPLVEVFQNWKPNAPPLQYSRPLLVKGSAQVEAITNSLIAQYFFTSETGALGQGVLSSAQINPIGIFEDELLQMEIYPNPTSGIINLPKHEAVTGYTVYTLAGNKLMDISANATTATLPKPGTYMFVQHFKNGRNKVAKVVMR